MIQFEYTKKSTCVSAHDMQNASQIMTRVLHINNKQVIDIAFVSQKEMAILNQRYRAKHGPTDVLSFEAVGPAERILCGSIVICISYAIKEANDFCKARKCFCHPSESWDPTVDSLPRRQAGCFHRNDNKIIHTMLNKRCKIDTRKVLLRLLVHGTLHLLGYDHATVKQEKQMFSLQERLLQEILAVK